MTSEFQNKKLEKGHPIQNYLDETLLIRSIADDLIREELTTKKILKKERNEKKFYCNYLIAKI